MTNIIQGSCSICGGAVAIPAAWMGVIPPIPTCQSCGAKKKNPHGPVIEMENTQTVKSWSLEILKGETK